MAIHNKPTTPLFKPRIPAIPIVIPIAPHRIEVPDRSIRTTYLGTDVYSSLIFKEAAIEREQDESITTFDSIPEIELLSAIMNVRKQKNVVTTEVQGRTGTVKEYISDGDYEISVRGFLTSEERTKAPTGDAAILGFMMTLGQRLEVAGSFLELFNIFTVVVMDFDISEMAGTRNQYTYRINMETDIPIELNLAKSEV